MDFGSWEERKTPWSARFGAGNRRRMASWDKRGVQAALADEGLGDYPRTSHIPDTTGRGGRTPRRGGPPKPTPEEKKLIDKAKAKERELAQAKRGRLPREQVKAIERAANAAAKKVPKEFGGKRR